MRIFLAVLFITAAAYGASYAADQDDLSSFSNDLKRIDLDLRRAQQDEDIRRMELRMRQRQEELEMRQRRWELESAAREQQLSSEPLGVVETGSRQEKTSGHFFVIALMLIGFSGMVLYARHRRSKKIRAEQTKQDNVVAQVNDWKLTELDVSYFINELKGVCSPAVLAVDSAVFRKSLIQDCALAELFFEMALSEDIALNMESPAGQQIESVSSLEPASVQGQVLIRLYATRLTNGNMSFVSYAHSFYYLLYLAYRKDTFYQTAMKRKFALIQEFFARAGSEAALAERVEQFINTLKAYRINP